MERGVRFRSLPLSWLLLVVGVTSLGAASSNGNGLGGYDASSEPFKAVEEGDKFIARLRVALNRTKGLFRRIEAVKITLALRAERCG
jgi:hypothetical protein